MRKGTLRRLPSPESGDHGTMSKLTVGMLEVYGGELAWRGDAKEVSCIPPSPGAAPVVYLLKLLWSEEHKRKVYHFVSMKKPDGTWGPLPDGRTEVEVHSANLMGDIAKGMLKQLLGCLALGRAIVPFPKGDKFKAMTSASPRKLTDATLMAAQIGLSSSGDAVKAFEEEMKGEDLELTVYWEVA